MSRLRQLPSLYGVRGSIATQTMKNLSREQVDYVEKVVIDIAADDALAGDKFEFIKQLRNTIQCDYRSDSNVAEHEFIIAIWRATVHLLYHCDYDYNCSICGQTEYETSTGKVKAFDRQYPICPKCKKTYYNGEISVLVKKQPKGYTLKTDDGEQIDVHCDKLKEMESKVKTPMLVVQGAKKIEDPQSVLDDPVQRSKWYSVWIWNYFRQILNENIIKTHNKHQVEMSNPAHLMAAYLIINRLQASKIKYYFDKSLIDTADCLEIFCPTNQMDLSFDKFMLSTFRSYREHGIGFVVTEMSVKITWVGDPPIVDDIMTMEDPVIMLSFDTPSTNSNNSDEGGSWKDVLEFNTKTDTIDDLDFEQRDFLKEVRRMLPNNTCRQVMDIYCQTGEIWGEFYKIHQKTSQPAKCHIAKFLNISSKKLDECKQQIGVVKRMFDPSDDNQHAYKISQRIINTYDRSIATYLGYGRDREDAIETAMLDITDDIDESYPITAATLRKLRLKNVTICEEAIFDAVLEDIT